MVGLEKREQLRLEFIELGLRDPTLPVELNQLVDLFSDHCSIDDLDLFVAHSC